MNKKSPKFEKGDLVILIDNDPALGSSGLGIIVSEPLLVLINKWGQIADLPSEFWCYDIVMDKTLFKEVPEKLLRGLKDENEKDSK